MQIHPERAQGPGADPARLSRLDLLAVLDD
jgi:hypothetical protein